MIYPTSLPRTLCLGMSESQVWPCRAQPGHLLRGFHPGNRTSKLPSPLWVPVSVANSILCPELHPLALIRPEFCFASHECILPTDHKSLKQHSNQCPSPVICQPPYRMQGCKNCQLCHPGAGDPVKGERGILGGTGQEGPGLMPGRSLWCTVDGRPSAEFAGLVLIILHVKLCTWL